MSIGEEGEAGPGRRKGKSSGELSRSPDRNGAAPPPDAASRGNDEQTDQLIEPAAGPPASRLRIVVERQPPEADPASQVPVRVPPEAQAIEPVRSGDRWVLPESALERALAEAKDLESLRALKARTAAVAALVRELRMSLEEQNKLAMLRIRLARKVGILLMQTPHRGGHGSNYHDGSSKTGGSSAPLPKGMNWHESSRSQRLAEIPEEALDQYFNDMRSRGRAITEAGLLRRVGAAPSGRTMGPRARSRAKTCTAAPALAAIWDAVRRLTNVDLAVGIEAPALECTRRVAEAPKGSLHGVIAVWAVGNEALWIPRVETARSQGRVSEAILVCSPEPAARWFRQLASCGWSACFVVPDEPAREASWLVVYRGRRPAGFEAAFGQLGAVVRGVGGAL